VLRGVNVTVTNGSPVYMKYFSEQGEKNHGNGNGNGNSHSHSKNTKIVRTIRFLRIKASLNG
jgi:hypothetical protein